MEYASGIFEPDSILLFQSLLRPDMVVVDLGAHLGYYSLVAAKEIGDKGKVYAFEPQPQNCDMLRKSIHANGYDNTIIVVQKAVSDKSGSFPLYLTEQGDWGATMSRSTGKQSISIEATTLDEFFDSQGWPAVQIIKMDVEGAEKAALEGMKELVKRNPTLKLIIEFSPAQQAASGTSNEEFFNALTTLGFQKFWSIQKDLKPINIPNDIPRQCQWAADGFINVLCER